MHRKKHPARMRPARLGGGGETPARPGGRSNRWLIAGLVVAALALGAMPVAFQWISAGRRHTAAREPGPREDTSPAARLPTSNAAPAAGAASMVQTRTTPGTNPPPGMPLTTNVEPATPADQAVALENRASELIARRQFAEAVVLLEQAAKLNPDAETVPFNMGYALARLGRSKEAEQSYLKALELFPEYTDAHNNLGNLLMNEGRFPEAVMHFSAALKADPESASAHNNLGTALAKQGNSKEALPHFLEAVRLQTNYLEAQFNLANAYLAQGRTDPAITQLQTIVREHPDFTPARQALERALRKQTSTATGK